MTISLMKDPYRFISNECARLGSDLFQSRFMLQKTICMQGKDAAEIFYLRDRFVRKNAAPESVRATLFGKGGVQGLDGQAHAHRKQMFMSLLSERSIANITKLAEKYWWDKVSLWSERAQVVLYDELQEILTRAICEWAGIPLRESEVELRTRHLTAMFDAAGSTGFRHFWARYARKRSNMWIAKLVKQVRRGELQVSKGSLLDVVSSHINVNGDFLPAQTAAAEIINVLRPTVAVSVYVVFIAHALEKFPACREKLRTGNGTYLEYFIQEVRRYYPFFPAVAARVRANFDWRGYNFQKGTRVLLDLYGTNHDPKVWSSPDEFRPERFRTWDKSAFNFIPQGGGDHHIGHRCAGEFLTLSLMKMATRFLTHLSYKVPEQDLKIDFSRLPALPRSRFIISEVVTPREAKSFNSRTERKEPPNVDMPI